MEQHAVPRQITSFEFKLIGFFTLKQFGYLVVFAGFAVLTYFLIPVPLLNILIAGGVFGLGLAFVTVKHNDRPIDVWIKNLFVRLFSASQYRYHKKNTPPAFLRDVFVYADPSTAASHLEARQKLASYTGPIQSTSFQKQEIHNLIHSMPEQTIKKSEVISQTTTTTTPQQMTTSAKEPVFVGVVRNNKETALPNIMLYIKDGTGKTTRILKTNSHGVFASFHALPNGTYVIEAKDLGSRYFFDTINITLPQDNKTPLTMYSKEII